MAWMADEDLRSYSRYSNESDMDALDDWIRPLRPLIKAELEDEIICVFANRTGTEAGATYAGTSAILGIQEGELNVYGILAQGQKGLLVVDTNKRPGQKLIQVPLPEATGSPTQDAPAAKQNLSISDQPNSSVNIPIAMALESSKAIEDELAPVYLTSARPEESSLYFPRPKSPIQRPGSPKSRNVSRTREPQDPGASLVEDLDDDASLVEITGGMNQLSTDPEVAVEVDNGWRGSTPLQRRRSC
jgi:hypothetical protein